MEVEINIFNNITRKWKNKNGWICFFVLLNMGMKFFMNKVYINMKNKKIKIMRIYIELRKYIKLMFQKYLMKNGKIFFWRF